MADRIQVLEELVAGHDGFALLVTDKQLIVDIAEGFDVVLLGADKWIQIQDPVFYDNDPVARDRAMEALPEIALVPRPPFDTLDAPTVPLDPSVVQLIEAVSSSRARAGAPELMADAARDFDRETGAWTDPQRYERYLASLAE